MVEVAPAYEPHLLEQEAQTVWKARRLPSPGGMLGPADGPVLHQYEGTFTPLEPAGLVAHRAVVADVDARYLSLAGRRAVGTLRSVAARPAEAESTLGPVLRRLGVWTGGDGATPWDFEDRIRSVETMVGRLAHRGILVSRDLPLRVCPVCAVPRSPERIIYQEEEGSTYLVRFDLSWNEAVVHALVWVDAPWRLLGASAILLHPELPYVVARYRRKDVDELVLTSRSSLDRLHAWIPGGSIEVLEEHPGRFFEGRPYDYPLRHEFPTGGTLAPPAGTVIAVTDVTDTGTGIVLLVPGHGSTDAAIAEAKGVSGWPLVTPSGRLDLNLMHKYAGLDLRTGNDFVVHDLTENGAIFAHLRVRRGVPHCADCGAALFWMPGRAWCLEPGRLPSDRLELYRRLLPGAPVPSQVEVAPWPVSETSRTTDTGAVAVLECTRCERLEALDGPVACSCGGKRYPVRRRLMPSVAGTLAAWARHDPFPVTDSVRLYVGERRRVPAVVHHLMAMSGLGGAVGEVGLTVLPTVTPTDLTELVEAHGADAVRVAFLRASAGVGAAGTFAERCAEEHERLARFWSLTQEVLARCDPSMMANFAQPVGNSLGELEVEDRALLARWERTRVYALADYDHWAPASAHRRVARFFETDLSEYRELVRPRLALAGSPPSKRSALRTLTHVLRSASVVLGPIIPHLSEAVYRRLAVERGSLFERTVAGADRALLNDELFAAWDRWRPVLDAVRRFRRSNGLTPQVTIPSAVVLLSADDVADRFRADRPVLERLAGIGRLDVGSPREPWMGRQRQVRPVESEIQRHYPAQATQIIHLLQRMSERKVAEEGTPAELSVVIQGLSRRIFPSMVAYSDTLPPRMVPWPWRGGEMYLEVPEGAKPPDRVPPPLSADAFWLVRKLDQRLRAAAPDLSALPRIAVISASDPLASELRGAADSLRPYLGLQEFRVISNGAEAPPPGRWTGRTRTGARWWVHFPGLSARPPGAKHRPTRPRSPRIPTSSLDLKTPETDYLSEGLLDREEAVRSLGLELDQLLGAPLLGPTKIARAWDVGLTSVEAYRRTSFETLADLPGFGRSIAEAVVVKLGGNAPPPRHHTPRSPFPERLPTESHSGAPTTQRAHPPPPRERSREAQPRPIPSPSEPTRPPSAVAAAPVEPGPPAPPAGSTDAPVSRAGPLLVGEPSLPVAPVDVAPPVGEIPAPDQSPEGWVGESSVPESVPPSEVTLPKETSRPASVTEPIIEVAMVPEVVPESSVEAARIPEPLPERSRPAPAPAEELSTAAVPESAAVERHPLEESPIGTLPAPLLEPPPREELPTQISLEEPVPPVESPRSEPLPEAQTDESEGSSVAPPALEPPLPAPLILENEREAASSLPPSPAVQLTPIAAPTHELGGTESGQPPAPSVPDGAGEPVPPAGPVAASEPPEVAPSLERAESETVPPDVADTESMVAEAMREPLRSELDAPSDGPPGVAANGPIVLPLLQEIVAPEVLPSTPPPTPSGIELEVGSSILTSILPFLDATAAGHRGLCVVRESPERIAAQVGSRPVDVYWLTNLGRGKTLKPNDLPGLLSFLARALEEDHVMAFFLEGIEYLVRIHGAEALIDRLTQFDRIAREHDVRVWMHVTPDLLAASDLERIVAAFGRRTDSG